MAVFLMMYWLQDLFDANRLTFIIYQGFHGFWFSDDRLNCAMIEGLTEQNLENQIHRNFQPEKVTTTLRGGCGFKPGIEPYCILEYYVTTTLRGGCGFKLKFPEVFLPSSPE